MNKFSLLIELGQNLHDVLLWKLLLLVQVVVVEVEDEVLQVEIDFDEVVVVVVLSASQYSAQANFEQLKQWQFETLEQAVQLSQQMTLIELIELIDKIVLFELGFLQVVVESDYDEQVQQLELQAVVVVLYEVPLVVHDESRLLLQTQFEGNDQLQQQQEEMQNGEVEVVEDQTQDQEPEHLEVLQFSVVVQVVVQEV